MSQPPQILLIENNPEDAVLLCLALEESVPNVQLSVVNDQTGLLAYLRYIEQDGHQMPWLIFLDVSFPTKTGGLEALSHLKYYFSTSSRPPVPVVAVSLSSQLAEVQAFYESGASSCLIKSDNFERLVHDCQVISKYWFKTVTLPPGTPE